MWEHNISVSGNEKLNYYFYQEIQLTKRVSSDRILINTRCIISEVKISAKITPRLTIINNTKYHYNSYSYPGLSGINNNFNTAVNHAGELCTH